MLDVFHEMNITMIYNIDCSDKNNQIYLFIYYRHNAIHNLAIELNLIFNQSIMIIGES